VFQPLAAYKTFATGLLLVLAVRYLPGGIFGAAVDRLRRVTAARNPAAAAQVTGTPS